MQRFIAYLKEEPSWTNLFFYILKATGLMIGLAIGALILVTIMLHALQLRWAEEGLSSNVITDDITFAMFATTIIPGVLREELLFRGPLLIPCFFRWKYVTLLVLVVTSTLFGFIHGNVFNIAIQGVSGFILGCVFLKCGGLNRNFAKACFSCCALHIFFDFVVMLPSMLGTTL